VRLLAIRRGKFRFEAGARIFRNQTIAVLFEAARTMNNSCRLFATLLAGFCSLPLVLTAAETPASFQDNWPQWRGPLATGVAPLANPPTEWSETRNVKWKVNIPGDGTASPIIWGDRVFVLTAIPAGKKIETKPEATITAKTETAPERPPGGSGEDVRRPGGPGGGPGRRPGGPGGFGGPGGMGSEKPSEIHQFVVMCLDRATGRVLWQQTAREELPHEGHHPTGSFASASPVTDGKFVFAFFGSRGLYAYDFNGRLQWSQNFGHMRVKNSFGEGSSPALHGSTLVVNWDHEGESFISALDKNTGKTLWKKAREEQTSWATPLIVESNGRAQVIQNATARVRSYDLATGDLLWETTGQTPNAIPTPVAAGDMVYVMSGFRGSTLQAIKLGQARGSLNGTGAIVWTHNKSTPYVPSPLLYGDNLFFFAVNNPILSCFDVKSGKALIDAERLEGIRDVYASPVGAGGRVYLTGRSGTTIVVKNSGKLEVMATNKLDEGIDASPAIVGREIFLRGKQHLYCIAEK